MTQARIALFQHLEVDSVGIRKKNETIAFFDALEHALRNQGLRQKNRVPDLAELIVIHAQFEGFRQLSYKILGLQCARFKPLDQVIRSQKSWNLGCAVRAQTFQLPVPPCEIEWHNHLPQIEYDGFDHQTLP